MPNEVECGVVASLLDSGATLAHASNATLVIGAAGCLLAHPIAARIAFAVSILCWFAECVLAIRTRIDASLFRMLAGDSATRSARMDQLLLSWGLVKKISARDMDQRCRGAIRLWRLQAIVFAVQSCALTVGLLIQESPRCWSHWSLH